MFAHGRLLSYPNVKKIGLIRNRIHRKGMVFPCEGYVTFQALEPVVAVCVRPPDLPSADGDTRMSQLGSPSALHFPSTCEQRPICKPGYRPCPVLRAAAGASSFTLSLRDSPVNPRQFRLVPHTFSFSRPSRPTDSPFKSCHRKFGHARNLRCVLMHGTAVHVNCP